MVHVVPRGAPQPPPQPEVPVASAPQSRPQEQVRERPLTAIVPPKPQVAPEPAETVTTAATAAPPPPPAQPVERMSLAREEAAAPTEASAASNSYARAIPIVPGNPIRPFTSDAKPARNMPTPGKFVTTEPGGWPPVTHIPVPKAGGVGVSTVTRGSAGPDGRFR